MATGEHPTRETGAEGERVPRIQIEAITEIKSEGLPSERLRALPWPIELQGKGAYSAAERTYVVRFPVGDRFLSYVTLIHELGHPRQHEHRPDLGQEPQTHGNLVAEETDAWERGWARFAAANTERLAALEQQFREDRTQGAPSRFSSFGELYQWVRDHVRELVEMERVLFTAPGDPHDRPESFDALADEWERAGVRSFLEEYAALRTGKTIDPAEAETTIRETIQAIEREF